VIKIIRSLNGFGVGLVNILKMRGKRSGKAKVSNNFVFPDLSKELIILWTISVAMGLIILGLSFCVSQNDVDNGIFSFLSVPHKNCLLCGMTHSFTLMSRGDFQQAWIWNPGGPILYLLLALNNLVGLILASIKGINILKNIQNRRIVWGQLP
jgi:hypothetical protein